ncbi:flippase-like domain-containing protein [Oenococcus sicerae]|uniref:Phosphatidylglycerol lysyltransferase n=1 Tax=Oenococcus sicerae TaxID=2203724 RepID=A0AAJ1RFV1_9LACO|nr:lysylphosphatidylglycerol synthase transmembrane domain-containing protein [Oenococcus sicerae]MDN6901061.1 flippase-like domain-containing protein [Oenococcus sicerae]QAS70093.1 flippase-like domain-containing protein [Oenococcus sicerae]
MSKKQRFFWILLTLFIGVIVFVYSFRKVNFKEFCRQIANTNYNWLLIAFLMIIFYYLTMTWILKILLRPTKVSFWGLIRTPLMEQFGNGITPFSVGGQPMQILGLQQAGVSVGEGSSVSLMKFVIYQGMIVVTFLICLVFGYQYVADHMLAMTSLVIFGIIIHVLVLLGLIFIMFFPPITEKLANIALIPFRWFLSDEQVNEISLKLDQKILEFHAVSHKLASDPKKLFEASCLTLIQLLVYYLIPYFILRAVGAENANAIFIVALNVILTLAISIFPVPGGAGGAEIGFSLLFSSFLANHTVTIFAMLVWRLMTYYFGIFAGLLAYNIIPNQLDEKNHVDN